MKEPNKTGLTTAITASILSLLCILLVVILPGFYLLLAQNFLHFVGVEGAAIKMTFGRAILGLVESFVIGYLIGYLFSYINLKLSKK